MSHAIPYGRQNITQDDIDSVVETLQSDYLTQGPAIAKFEQSYAEKTNAKHACAVTSATAALHLAYQALDFGEGDILWTVPNTFVATSNAALYLNGTIDFVDIDIDDFCISIEKLEIKLKQAKTDSKLPKIVTPVHFGGMSCDMQSLARLAKEYNFKIVEDASHCVGAIYDDICVFSFHPVKIITTGEGGMITTNDPDLFDKIMMARTHGITKDPQKMINSTPAPWEMEQHFLGFNYRMTDIQAALGHSQLQRLDDNMKRRCDIAKKYQKAFHGLPIKTQKQNSEGQSSWHLFPVLFETSKIRQDVYNHLRENDIFAQVHYIPVHTQPYYKGLGFEDGDFPVAEDYYSRCLSIPMYHGLDDTDQERVIKVIKDFFND